MNPTVFISVGTPEVRHYRQHSRFSSVRIADGVRVLFHGADHENDAEEFLAQMQSLSGPEPLENVDLIVDK